MQGKAMRDVPEALRLADALKQRFQVRSTHHYLDRDAANELRRLHAENESLRAALAEPVQEPVAKVELMTTGGNAGLATRIVEIDDHLRERLRPGQLLYTAPPQRKPLTEKEIKRLVSNDMVQFARAIERAHGIGE